MRAMGPAEIARATGGEWLEPRETVPQFEAVSTDSRKIVPGCLFLPLKGESFDGHRYIDAALDAGAAGCLCSRPPAYLRPDKCYILVPDVRRALGDLASAYREEFQIPFIQITGSVGKTTAKDLIAAVLSTRLRVLKTPENHNNDIGVPLALLDLDPGHQAAVIETGMNHFGEIERLGQIVRPDIAVITNIGDAHMEHLGSREGILRAKCEIFEHLQKGGLAVLNGDDALLDTVAPPFRTVRCGYAEGCPARIVDFRDHSVDGIECTVRTRRDTYELKIPSPGAHMVWPAAMAATVGEELGLDRDEIVRGVASYTPSGSRMRPVRASGGRILLDDCYNASPQSVAAALEVLARTECESRVAVLGDMGELGEITEKAHYNVGALTAMLGIDFVVAIGEKAAGIAEGASQNGGEAVWFPTKDAAMEELRRQWAPGTAMLVKASHAMGFGELVERLLDGDGA